VEFPCSPCVCGCVCGFSLGIQASMHVRLIGDSKWTLGESVDGCLSRLCLCGPVMDW